MLQRIARRNGRIGIKRSFRGWKIDASCKETTKPKQVSYERAIAGRVSAYTCTASSRSLAWTESSPTNFPIAASALRFQTFVLNSRHKQVDGSSEHLRRTFLQSGFASDRLVLKHVPKKHWQVRPSIMTNHSDRTDFQLA